MNWEVLLSGLFGMTLLAGVGFGIYQYMSVKRSREKRGEEGHVSHPPVQNKPAGDDTPLR